jgi:ADP-ribosylglycohydrolase
MSVDWPFADGKLSLGGTSKVRIQPEDADRQTVTAKEILRDFSDQPGLLLSDEVGMGKTYVALAVAASVIVATKGNQGPVVIMVPSRLRRKWQREWEQFKRHCVLGSSLDWIKDTYAYSPTEFFKLLDDDDQHRKQLVFITTGCFSGGLGDPWIKLAMIRLARSRTKMTAQQKNRIYRWAADLVRLVSQKYLTEDVVRKLMRTDLDRWKDVLVREWVLDENADDPIPALLMKCEDRIDWSPLVEVIRQSLPKRDSATIRDRLKTARGEFNTACRAIYQQWLQCSRWHSPLLVLDEAHHAKNDNTLLAQLFRRSSEEDVSLLSGKFQRMLFLTATPFQLGHQELIRVLRSFDAIRWSSPKSPPFTAQDFETKILQVEEALDRNRLAGRHLDRLWGDIRPDMLGGQEVESWWCRVENAPADEWEKRLVQAVQDCRETRIAAEKLLRPWVVRHNRPVSIPGGPGKPALPRRQGIVGRGVLPENEETSGPDVGLPIAKESALPFLLTARAQGELAHVSGARAFFAEGLASSYEAFHHTREARGKARDMDDGGHPVSQDVDEEDLAATIVPTAWYEDQVASLIPSRDRSPLERLRHPKVSATVHRVVDLWEGGEKVLVFCFYRETCKALYEHIREAVHTRTLAIAREKLGDEYAEDDTKVQDFLTRIARRFSEPDRPFYREVRDVLSRPFVGPKYRCLQPYMKELIEVLAAYFRAPSFLARYLPLNDPAVQRAWELGEGRREVLEPGLLALRRGILEQRDRSNQTYMERVYQFLDFAVELAERAQTVQNDGEEDDEPVDPLKTCLDAVSVYSRPRKMEDIDRDDDDVSGDDDGSYRVVPLARVVHGDTKPETRERLALAFNSPLFPEILVSSGVMGEGIDLHRFCRQVVHHDGYWNPSTLEQQTGRIDRIRCKAEICALPIRVYQPFLAGSADEKMYRVVRDRERWFQIVMGQKFEFDEGTSEAIASRVPLPERLAKELTFDLARWKESPRVQRADVVPPSLAPDVKRRDRLRGALIGLAVGDALGAAVEFKWAGSFEPVTGFRGGGPHGLGPGEWTDDTSMALALADSLANAGWDLNDQAARYVAWWRCGQYSVNGRCFDIGITTRGALSRFERDGDAQTTGDSSEHASGNGSIMRLAPVPIRYVDLFPDRLEELLQKSRDSSLPTHASPQCLSCCAYLGLVLCGLFHGADRDVVLSPVWPALSTLKRAIPLHPEVLELAAGSFRTNAPPEIVGSGYVVKSLEAALWAFHAAKDFREAVLRAVNLGDDADTTGAVCGQLAGAYWGESGIPGEWLEGLAQRDMIDKALRKLLDNEGDG